VLVQLNAADWVKIKHLPGVFVKPSSGLEPETPSLPFKLGMSQAVPTCPSQTEETLEMSEYIRDAQGQRNPCWHGLMLPDCCPIALEIVR
jgi:hypothetical protein